MITRQMVIDAVCEEYGITRHELLEPHAGGAIGRARNVAYQVLHDAGWSWREVGLAMNLIAGYGGRLREQARRAPALELRAVREAVGLRHDGTALALDWPGDPQLRALWPIK